MFKANTRRRKGLPLFLAALSLLTVLSLSGQCPDRDFLWNRLTVLKNDTNISPEKKWAELERYAAEMRSCPYQHDSTHALLLKQMGITAWNLGHLDDAIRYTRQSVDMIAAYDMPSPIDRYRLLYCQGYYNLAYYNDNLHHPRQRNEAIDTCVSLALTYKLVDKNIVSLLQPRVKYLFNVGDYQRCLLYTDLGRLLTSQYLHQSADSINLALFFLTWEANVLNFYKRYGEEQKLLFDNIESCRKANDKKDLGYIYGILGDAYLDRTSGDSAIDYYQKSFTAIRQAGDDVNCKTILNNLGSVYLDCFHNESRALAYYRQAIAYPCRNAPDTTKCALQNLYAYDRIAVTYLRKGMYDSCFVCFRLALDQLSPGLRETDLLHMDMAPFSADRDIDIIINLLLNEAGAYQQEYKATHHRDALAAALSIYKTTDLLLDKLRPEQSELQSLLYWREASHRLYENAIETAWLAGKTAEAFYFFDKGHAVLLNDQLNELHSMQPEEIRQLAQIREQMRQTTSIDDRFARLQELDRLTRLVRERNVVHEQSVQGDGVGERVGGDSLPINLAEVRRRLLGDHQALVELFDGDSAVYGMLVTDRKSWIYRIGKNDFDSTADLFVHYLSDPARLNADFEGYRRTAYHLYQLVFQGNAVPDGRIIICPDGRYFPFEALVCNKAPSSPLYFLEDHAISYTYSATYLMNRYTSEGAVATGNFLGVAPITFHSLNQLSPLEGSDASLATIGADFYRPYSLIAAGASRRNFLRTFSGYKVIELYTHAADSSAQGEPVIYLADSALYLSDLIPKDRPATQLIVLSACETGNGKLYRGEGVFSFNRGFAALGIPSCVTNLWMVDDRSTYRLTELFYQQLALGLPQDIALQQAKKAFILANVEEGKLPYYWAAPILVGQSSPIEYSRPFPWGLVLALLGIGLLTVWGLWRIKTAAGTSVK